MTDDASALVEGMEGNHMAVTTRQVTGEGAWQRRQQQSVNHA